MEAQKKPRHLPRTLIVAAPIGLYALITGSWGYGMSWKDTLILAGSSFVIVLFLPQILTGAGRALKAYAARSRAKAAKKKTKEK
ncbi:hypothetical protein ABZ569_32345 [Streptomyces albus]|uniref:hypothetical protein n=1 Tax=Streptomyces albus TaxID=1888 RepID=UPI00340FC048